MRLVLGEVAQGFRRNLSMVVSVILVTFISLTFFGAAILLQFQIGQMKGYWYDRAQVSVYLCYTGSLQPNCGGVEATEAQRDAVQAELEGPTLEPYIDTVTFETKQQAYENFLEQFGDSEIASLANPEILPESFRIRLEDPDQADIIIDQISGLAGVDEVTDQRALLDPIFAVINAVSLTAVGIAGLMLVAAVLLIATTIRLSAFSRRREISIMRLVGASNRFIQTPFVLEGVLSGLIGAALAGGAVVVIVQFFVRGYLAQNLSAVAFVGLDDALAVVPILLGVGALLAALSSSFAISRYLKV